ncbi:MAG: hypothetical protein PHQ19_08145, partial [Candidatus Krumholzibacteria bacterium]|nr:hypothetical protein [Candidatus Krumholzibacteria bacterium]
MQEPTRHLLLFGAATVAQLVTAGGLAALLVVARTGADRLYPRGVTWTRCARLMQGGGLHAVLVLAGLEAAVIAWAAALIPPLCGGDAARLPWGASWIAAAVPAVLIQLAAAVTGVGIAVGRPAAAARIFSIPLCPVYLVLRPLADLFLRAVSLVFPDLSRELSAPFMALPHPESPGEGFIEENGSRLVRS